tara:strand:- start:85 stop:558 length:474 start_codon:yes stop_codon:yes gene_type:complete
MSREIDNISRNIEHFQNDITLINSSNETNSEKIRDLDEIKMNRIDAISELDKIRNDFKFMQDKLDLVNKCVKNLLSKERNVDYVNKNTATFKAFLMDVCGLNLKKTNVLLYVFECLSAQDFFLINEDELIDYGFTNEELNNINRECKNELESNIYPM